MPPLTLLLALARGGGGSVVPPPTAYSMLYNGQEGDGFQKIGLATTTDAGATWTRYASNPVIDLGANGTWNDAQLHGPQIAWDGSQWVMYASGYDGSSYRIGRWTSADLITWTPYGSNPVIGLGSGSDADAAGAVGPVLLYVSGDARPWKVWYSGESSGAVFTLCFADSANGISFTKYGTVIGLGSSGAFDDVSTGGGCVVKIDSTYHVFYAGSSDTGITHPGRATCTDPADVDTYTKQGVLSALSGNVTSLDDGLTYTACNLTSIVERNGQYMGFGTAFHPTPDIGQHEVAFRTTATTIDGAWSTPVGVLLPLDEGTFDTTSAENPCVVAA